MTRRDFASTIARLEKEAGERPRLYKLRVLALAVLGYVYLIFVVAGLFGVMAALIVTAAANRAHGGGALAKLCIPIAILEFFILRALWVRVPAPQGIRLTPAMAGELFTCIENIRGTLETPRVHRVLLDGDFNASVAQRPRLGLFGWQRNYLTVGLPLMLALSREEFESVIAHELGHLSGAHGHFTAWIYRLRTTWWQLHQELERRNQWGSFLFIRFLNWYAPVFNAYTFVLARAHEYEADRRAARVAGARTTAAALVRGALRGCFLSEEFWPKLYDRVQNEPEPPAGFVMDLMRALLAGAGSAEAAAHFEKALKEKADVADTHPSLADRVGALGQALPALLPEAQRGVAVEETAAAALLGTRLDALRREVERVWREGVKESWARRYAEMREGLERLGKLERVAGERRLTVEEALEQAMMTADLKSEKAAVPLLEAVLVRDPDQPRANFLLGRFLLGEGDDRGIGLIERAMRIEPAALPEGTSLICAYLERKGRIEEADQFETMAAKRALVLAVVEQERSTLTAGDTFIPHGLPPETVARVAEQLRREPRVKEAYLVRKVLKSLPDRPCYLVGMTLAYRWCDISPATVHQDVMQHLASTVESTVPLVFFPLGADKKVAKTIATVPDAKIL